MPKAKVKEKAKQKTAGRKAKFKPEYVFELCVEMYKDELDRDDRYTKRYGLLAHERLIAEYTEKRGSEEAGMKRFRDHAQIYAPHVRAVLLVLERWGQLPKEAKV